MYWFILVKLPELWLLLPNEILYAYADITWVWFKVLHNILGRALLWIVYFLSSPTYAFVVAIGLDQDFWAFEYNKFTELAQSVKYMW